MMDKGMKKRWISLYVENQVGVLSKISGLFSGKSYNLDSLTVGTTEDPTVSRMTIATVSDDETFEQIKKQLNRMIEVIKVIDFTDVFVRMKEILYIKVKDCSPEDKAELFQIAETFKHVSSTMEKTASFWNSSRPQPKMTRSSSLSKKSSNISKLSAAEVSELSLSV